MKFIFQKKSFLVLFQRWNWNSPFTTTTTSRTVPHCKIMDLEVNREIYRSDLYDGYLNKSVEIALSENILVPRDSLLAGSRFRGDLDGHFALIKKCQTNKQIKIGYFTPLDKSLILSNTDSLVDHLSVSSRKKTKALKEIFIEYDLEDEYLLEKIHIVGLYLSQGMKDTRLPCDVFQTAKVLHLTKKNSFSAEEDKLIMQYMNNEGLTSSTPYAELSRKLNRTASSIRHHYKNILKVRNAVRCNLTYKKEENVKIMKAVFDADKDVLKGSKIAFTSDVWKQLGVELNRKPANIWFHWNYFIFNTLSRHQSNLLHVDFRELLIDYCLKNNIMFSKEANWDEIGNNPMFKGSTSSHLKRVYGSLRNNTRRKYPNIPDHQVTSETMRKYLDERIVRKSRKRKDIEEILTYFEELKLRESNENK